MKNGKVRKRWLCLMMAGMMAMSTALAGCGGGGTESTAAGNGGGETTAGTEAQGETTGAKDTLVIGHYGDPPTLDPNNAMNDCSMRITTNIYDTLVRMDEHFQAQPCLAESWEISDDGLEYTFKIRDDVKFHNGDPLTVEDVVFSIERGIESPKASPSYTRVVGAEAVDEHHVKVTLTAPYNQILANLALPFGPIVSKSYVEEVGDEAFASQPMGTGPYKFVEWVRGEKVVLEANEDYFMGAPAIKHVEYVVIADTSAALLNLESGDIDAYCDIQTSDYALAQQNPEIQIVEGSALGYEFLQFNTAKAPFDNVKVRQAVAHALDKDAMLQGINDGIGIRIDTVVLEDAVGYTDDFTKYDYNLETAKSLLAEAGYPDGFTCDIHVTSDLYAKYAQVLQSALMEIGITAEIKQEELSAYDVSTSGGDYDMAINGCSFTVMDVYESCGDSLYGEKIGDTNDTFYNNPRLNELFEEALGPVDDQRLAEIYTEVIQIVADDVPMIPFIWRVRNITCDKDLNIPFVDPYGFHFLYDWSWNS